MTTDTLDLPPIEVLDAAPAHQSPATPAAQAESAIALMRRTTVAELTAVDRGLAKLRADHGAINYDITTPKGMQAAKDHRLAVRNVRYQIPHTVKARKAELKEVSELLDGEAERITAALLAIEKPHDDAIKAREQQLADEKAERDRKAAKARAKVDAAIGRLRGATARCDEPGMTAARIAGGIELVEGIGLSAEELGDAVPEVEQVRQQVLATMREKRDQAQVREDEAARLEALRVDNERMAADLAATKARLDEQAAELQRQAAELAEAQRAAQEAAQPKQDAEAQDAGQSVAVAQAAETGKAETLGHDEPEAAPNTHAPAGVAPQNHPLPEAEAVPGMGTAGRPSLASFTTASEIGGVLRPAGIYLTGLAGAAVGDDEPAATLKLGDIRDRLQFALTEAFITDVLAIPVRATEGRARLWRESDWAAIKAGLVAYVGGLP